MLGSILSKIGGAIGKSLGGGILSTIARYSGKMLGNYLENKALHRREYKHKFTNIKDGFLIKTARYGTPIPLIFGKMRIDGQIIWINNIHQKRNDSVTISHFKRRHTTLEKHNIRLEYYADFAMALCEGEISEIGQVWFDDQLINLGPYNFRLYKGDEEQLPDPLISNLSNEPTPAYRGLAYIVFEKLPLADFGDVIPHLSFEITRKPNIRQGNSVENLVKAITMIPGSGEYVYDTKIQTKSVLLPSGADASTTILNSHNHYNIANTIHSLNQLQSTCPNVKWVAPVVCWFGNNLNAKDCTIKPAIEFKDSNISYSEEWSVGGYQRNNAHEISKDELQNPLYGGSVNDASVIRYLDELKKRGLKIMFYPMLFLDLPQKPWRGHLTTDARYIHDFFHKQHGYNDFILHYAKLAKNHIDVFIIGSELIGLTKLRDGDIFPAVNELIELAQRVKEIVGPNVSVTYAADWSEYHHTTGGWYNLDPLWASEYIDFIGIDAYFPATNTTSSIITSEEISAGWRSGEGYDYYVDYQDNSKHELKPEYAWKNLRYWWENKHKNPDGNITAWRPKSKPIWFTEFGFPSIDKATNQPNIFFDPKCTDGGVPRHSNGSVDFAIQRKAIKAFIEYWQTQEYIGEMFLWTWDARPYPAWPDMNFWQDGNLWEKGHWVNNKFGSSNLTSILLEISNRCGIDINHIDVSTIDEIVEGFALSNQITAINAINLLRASYFFDICAHNGEIISFEKRGYKDEINIKSEICLKISDNNFIEEIEIPKEMTLSAIHLYFLNPHKKYDSDYIYINNEINSCKQDALINFPILLTEASASNIGKLILKNAETENRIIKFIINNNIIQIKPTDFIILQHLNRQYSIRIIHTQIDAYNKMTATGIIDQKYNYFHPQNTSNQLELEAIADIESDFVVLDSPFAFEDIQGSFLAVYLRHNTNNILYARTEDDMDYNWNRIATISPSYSIGQIIEFKQNNLANKFMIDNSSQFIIKGYKLEQHISNNWNTAMIGEELVRFKNLEKLQDGLYQISCLTRGENGTEDFIHKHAPLEDFVIINSEANIIPVSKKLTNKKIFFKLGKIEKSITYKNKASTLLKPHITKQDIIENHLHLQWISLFKSNEDWANETEPKDLEFTILIHNGDQTHTYKTPKNEIIIDISDLTLSADYLITILVNII